MSRLGPHTGANPMRKPVSRLDTVQVLQPRAIAAVADEKHRLERLAHAETTKTIVKCLLSAYPVVQLIPMLAALAMVVWPLGTVEESTNPIDHTQFFLFFLALMTFSGTLVAVTWAPLLLRANPSKPRWLAVLVTVVLAAVVYYFAVDNTGGPQAAGLWVMRPFGGVVTLVLLYLLYDGQIRKESIFRVKFAVAGGYLAIFFFARSLTLGVAFILKDGNDVASIVIMVLFPALFGGLAHIFLKVASYVRRPDLGRKRAEQKRERKRAADDGSTGVSKGNEQDMNSHTSGSAYTRLPARDKVMRKLGHFLLLTRSGSDVLFLMFRMNLVRDAFAASAGEDDDGCLEDFAQGGDGDDEESAAEQARKLAERIGASRRPSDGMPPGYTRKRRASLLHSVAYDSHDMSDAASITESEGSFEINRSEVDTDMFSDSDSDDNDDFLWGKSIDNLDKGTDSAMSKVRTAREITRSHRSGVDTSASEGGGSGSDSGSDSDGSQTQTATLTADVAEQFEATVDEMVEDSHRLRNPTHLVDVQAVYDLMEDGDLATRDAGVVDLMSPSVGSAGLSADCPRASPRLVANQPGTVSLDNLSSPTYPEVRGLGTPLADGRSYQIKPPALSLRVKPAVVATGVTRKHGSQAPVVVRMPDGHRVRVQQSGSSGTIPGSPNRLVVAVRGDKKVVGGAVHRLFLRNSTALLWNADRVDAVVQRTNFCPSAAYLGAIISAQAIPFLAFTMAKGNQVLMFILSWAVYLIISAVREAPGLKRLAGTRRLFVDLERKALRLRRRPANRLVAMMAMKDKEATKSEANIRLAQRSIGEKMHAQCFQVSVLHFMYRLADIVALCNFLSVFAVIVYGPNREYFPGIRSSPEAALDTVAAALVLMCLVGYFCRRVFISMVGVDPLVVGFRTVYMRFPVILSATAVCLLVPLYGAFDFARFDIG